MKKSSNNSLRHALLFFLLSLPGLGNNPVQLNLQTINGLTIDRIYPYNTEICQSTSATYVKGGNTITGRVNNQSSEEQCSLGFEKSDVSPALAINSRDHLYLQSNMVPTVVDFGSRQKTVVVFNATIRTPVPEQALKKTVWGSDNNDVSNFPDGWTMATLNTIWKKGFVEFETCPASPKSDDYSAQYTFPKKGHRYIAIYGNASVSIFKTRDNVTWNTENDDHPSVIGWQSHDEESDAVMAPQCQSIPKANAGPDKQGNLGNKICFKAIKTGTEPRNQIINFGWDVDDNGTVDVTQEEACVRCDAKKTGKMRLYVTDQCGCTDTDAVNYNCTNARPEPASEAAAPAHEEAVDEETADDEDPLDESDDANVDASEATSEMDDGGPSPLGDPGARRGPGELGGGGEPANEGAFGGQGMGNQGDFGNNMGGNLMGGNNMGGNSMGNGQNMNNGMNPYGMNGFNSGLNGLGPANFRTKTHMSGSGTPPIIATSKSPACSTQGPADSLLGLLFVFYGCFLKLRRKDIV